MSRDPPPIKPTIYRLTSASTLRSPSTLSLGGRLLSSLGVSQPSSPLVTVPPSLREITPKRSDYSFTTLSPETKGRDAWPYEDEDARPHTSSQVAIQGPSRRGTGESDSSQAPVDPLQHDSNELWKAQVRNPANGHPHGARQSSTNLHSTFDGRDASRKDVRSLDSGELATHGITCTGADIAIGVDLNHGSDGDEGRYWAKTPRNKGGSRMLLCFNPCLLIA